MNWLAKVRLNGMATAATPARPGPVSAHPNLNVRTSNALKEFLWLIGDVPHARILDLGPVWQSTVNFLGEKGFRISTEDLLVGWKQFVTDEEERLRIAPVAPAGEEGEIERLSSSLLAEKFLMGALQYPAESFHGLLLWDLLDYFDAPAGARIMEGLFSILHPGGVLLALFHSRPAERFNRYRILDAQNVEIVAAPTLAVHTRVFQNREILELFEKFRSSKTFVGRDQVREALFLK
ncbi:MAG TPA: hypothetical protein VNE63_16750 [Candidatus Acidoferrales bacterium]|nr:hypothetical protein [Candidatus Acidoferrales bacterium]